MKRILIGVAILGLTACAGNPLQPSRNVAPSAAYQDAPSTVRLSVPVTVQAAPDVPATPEPPPVVTPQPQTPASTEGPCGSVPCAPQPPNSQPCGGPCAGPTPIPAPAPSIPTDTEVCGGPCYTDPANAPLPKREPF